MTAGLAEIVGDYLRVRRALGYKLSHPGHVLTGFLDYLTARGTDTVTIENALGFATAPVGVSPRTQALRLSAIRGFAKWAHTMDPTVQVPPAGCYRLGRPGLFPISTPTTRSRHCSVLRAGYARRPGRRVSARCWP